MLTTNADELLIGYTGDTVDLEELAGYMRPVGNASVFKPSAICEMVDAAAWAGYCSDFPDVAKLALRHSGQPPKTGTSLGYNALWYGPHVEAEIVSEHYHSPKTFGEQALTGEPNSSAMPSASAMHAASASSEAPERSTSSAASGAGYCPLVCCWM